MPKTQVNIRLSTAGRHILDALVEHFSERSLEEAGRPTTQAQVFELGLRLLASRKKIPINLSRKD